MAVAISNLTTGSDTDGNSTATTASVSPAGDNLLLLTVASRTGISTNPNQPTVTGNGLTWVAEKTTVYDDSSSSRRRITVFRAMGASPSTGAITIDFGGQNQTTAIWSLDQLSGTDTTGTNGSGAIVQSVANQDTTGTGASLTVTLAAFGSANNATFGGFGNGNGTNTSTAGTGFTKSGDVTDSADIRLTTEFVASNDTSVDMSWSGASEVGGVGIEIKAFVATVVSTIAPQRLTMGVGT